MVAERRLMVNVRRKQVRVEPTRRSTRRAVANMRVCKGLLAEIDGKVGNVNACLLLDTGAQNYIADMALSDALRKHHPRLQRVDNVRVYVVTGHKVVGQFIAMPRVNLKAFHVDDAGCVAADASIFDVWDLSRKPAMIVGVNLLSRLDCNILRFREGRTYCAESRQAQCRDRTQHGSSRNLHYGRHPAVAFDGELYLLEA